MATTPNYNFIMPDPTDLVTDLPADFEIFGDEVDLRVKALNPETTEGDIAYRGATADAKDRLGIGTAGQLLAVNSGATAPEWIAAPASGGMTLIASLTAVAATAISFTSIPATHKHLLITVSGIQSVTNEGWGLRFNNDTGSNNDYSMTGIHLQDPTSPNINIIDASASSGFGIDNSDVRGVILSHQAAGRGHVTTEFWVFDYTDAANEKVVRWNARGSRLANQAAHAAFCFNQATFERLVAIDRIDFIRSSTQTFTGIVRLYGVS